MRPPLSVAGRSFAAGKNAFARRDTESQATRLCRRWGSAGA